jgi:hypothetical protein
LPAYTEFLEVWNLIINNDKVIKEKFLKQFEENKKNLSVVSSTQDGNYTTFLILLTESALENGVLPLAWKGIRK